MKKSQFTATHITIKWRHGQERDDRRKWWVKKK